MTEYVPFLKSYSPLAQLTAARRRQLNAWDREPLRTLALVWNAQNRALSAGDQWTLAEVWLRQQGRLTEALSASETASRYDAAEERLSRFGRMLQGTL